MKHFFNVFLQKPILSHEFNEKNVTDLYQVLQSIYQTIYFNLGE